MTLYDVLAPVYDPAFEAIHRPFRRRALETFPLGLGATVLDLACGTGQNFPFLARRIGAQGRIVGVDISAGMLRRARRRAAHPGVADVTLVKEDAARLSRDWLKNATGLDSVDAIVCSHGFTVMREWKAGFLASWEFLAPGGRYLILDVDGQRRNAHTRMVETVTRCDFARKVWQPLESRCADFRMDYIEPSAHLFGGRLFVAYGTRAAPTTRSPCPS